MSTLKAQIRVYNLMIVFLSDTKANEERMKKVAGLIGFPNFVAISSKGRAGGVCLFWANEIAVHVLEFNYNTIVVTVTECNIVWFLIGFYGPPSHAKKMKVWVSLHGLLETIEGPWLCFGDFNVVIDELEKDGGRCGCSSTPSFLKDLLFNLSAVDLGFAGNKFTWSNKRWGHDCIRERLDKGIASINWALCFLRATVYHLGALNSNHCLLLIDINPVDTFAPRPFRFEAIWAKDLRCYSVIDEAWQKQFCGSNSFILCRKQFFTTSALKKWNRETFGFC